VDHALSVMDAALQTLGEVSSSLQRSRAQAATIADATAWQSRAVARYRRSLRTWDDEVARLVARLTDEQEQLRMSRLARQAALAEGW